MVGRDRASSGPRRAARTSAGRRTTPSGTCCSATTASAVSPATSRAASCGGGQGSAGQWGPTGWLRMFNTSFGGQISWLLPAALILLVAGLAITVRRPRTDRTRAALLLWGSWLLVTGAAFSLSARASSTSTTRSRSRPRSARSSASAAGCSGSDATRDGLVSCSARRSRSPGGGGTRCCIVPRRGCPWLRVFVLAAGLFLGIGIAAAPALRGRVAAAAGIGALAVALTAPAAYALSTVRTPHTGAIPHRRARRSCGAGSADRVGGFANGPRFGNRWRAPEPPATGGRSRTAACSPTRRQRRRVPGRCGSPAAAGAGSADCSTARTPGPR